MKSYDEYKEINLPWLKEIPKHWDIEKAKKMFDVIDERSIDGNEELLSVSAKNGVLKRKDANVTMFKAKSYVGYKLCWKNDLAVNSLWAWQYGLGFSKYHGIISTAYSVYRLRNLSVFFVKYYDYYVRSTAFQWELRVRSKGIWKSRYQLADDSFLDSPMICPPFNEQKQIVNYLDSKTSKINKLVQLKKKEIELLKEYRRALITKAVTKGIHEGVKMKDSGIEWIGEIPENWDIGILKKLFTLHRGYDLPNDKFVNGSIPVYGSNGILGYHNEISSNAPNVVIGRSGSAGKLNYVNEDFFAHNTSIYISNNKNNNCRYIFYLLHAIDIDTLITKTAVPTLDRKKIQNKIFVYVNNNSEQKEIADYLDKKCSSIDKLISEKQSVIEKLSEYKTRLISDAVTGKIDVRDIKIEDSDFVEEDTVDYETDEDPINV